MKNKLSILLFFFSLAASAQDNTTIERNGDSTVIDINSFGIDRHKKPSSFTKKNAINDIKNDSLKLVISLNIYAIEPIKSSKYDGFQKKYNVEFYFHGCLAEHDRTNEDIDGYNTLILEYLSKQHGQIVLSEFKQLE